MMKIHENGDNERKILDFVGEEIDSFPGRISQYASMCEALGGLYQAFSDQECTNTVKSFEVSDQKRALVIKSSMPPDIRKSEGHYEHWEKQFKGEGEEFKEPLLFGINSMITSLDISQKFLASTTNIHFAKYEQMHQELKRLLSQLRNSGDTPTILQLLVDLGAVLTLLGRLLQEKQHALTTFAKRNGMDYSNVNQKITLFCEYNFPDIEQRAKINSVLSNDKEVEDDDPEDDEAEEEAAEKLKDLLLIVRKLIVHLKEKKGKLKTASQRELQEIIAEFGEMLSDEEGVFDDLGIDIADLQRAYQNLADEIQERGSRHTIQHMYTMINLHEELITVIYAKVRSFL